MRIKICLGIQHLIYSIHHTSPLSTHSNCGYVSHMKRTGWVEVSSCYTMHDKLCCYVRWWHFWRKLISACKSALRSGRQTEKRLCFCSFTGFPRQMSGLTTRQLQVNYWAALYITSLVKETWMSFGPACNVTSLGSCSPHHTSTISYFLRDQGSFTGLLSISSRRLNLSKVNIARNVMPRLNP